MTDSDAVEQAVGMFQIREMRQQDVGAVAQLHYSCLPDGFFAALGPRFLRRYHATFLSKSGVAFVAVNDGAIIGMAVGTSNDGEHYRETVRTQGKKLALVAGVSLVTRPKLLAKFLKTRVRRYVRGFRKLSGSGAKKPQAVTGSLVHIAVSPVARGTGVGKALVEKYVNVVSDRGIARPRVVTKADNTIALKFYESLGWRQAGTTTDLDGNEFVRFELGNSPQGR
jgi:ribosomal protein S18 acetylase RimI-like enzyme